MKKTSRLWLRLTESGRSWNVRSKRQMLETTFLYTTEHQSGGIFSAIKVEPRKNVNLRP